ncbi:hypothetical protein EVAR_86193_1 [Eumeta japonica]|uniref:Uncharacterized protein n=1 Tax=Eumeta variegata TaxID=151549 RepID=A0A4C1UBT4_EUMVA|nr:hypothetical protein EVAR_86193_1 [Eumeta japonica]
MTSRSPRPFDARSARPVRYGSGVSAPAPVRARDARAFTGRNDVGAVEDVPSVVPVCLSMVLQIYIADLTFPRCYFQRLSCQFRRTVLQTQGSKLPKLNVHEPAPTSTALVPLATAPPAPGDATANDKTDKSFTFQWNFLEHLSCIMIQAHCVDTMAHEIPIAASAICREDGAADARQRLGGRHFYKLSRQMIFTVKHEIANDVDERTSRRYNKHFAKSINPFRVSDENKWRCWANTAGERAPSGAGRGRSPPPPRAPSRASRRCALEPAHTIPTL